MRIDNSFNDAEVTKNGSCHPVNVRGLGSPGLDILISNVD